MGLDQYLERKTYVKNWDHMKPEELHKITVKKGGKTVKDIKPKRISHIIEEVAYWRKANHIHKWFVDNCQDGADDCREAYVAREQLAELLSICKEIKKNPQGPDGRPTGATLLPCESGFFFGSTDYDECYYQDIDYTIKVLEEVLAEKSSGDFYYNSSW